LSRFWPGWRHNDLSLLSGTGSKCRGDQSHKSYEKWSRRGNDDDLTKGAKTCIFNPDGVFGIHNQEQQTRSFPLWNIAFKVRPHP